MFVYKFICFKFAVGILAFREKGEEKMKNLKVTEVAEILGISADSVRKGIIDGTLEFGRCIRMKKNVFVIPEERFKNWLKGN